MLLEHHQINSTDIIYKYNTINKRVYLNPATHNSTGGTHGGELTAVTKFLHASPVHKATPEAIERQFNEPLHFCCCNSKVEAQVYPSSHPIFLGIAGVFR